MPGNMMQNDDYGVGWEGFWALLKVKDLRLIQMKGKARSCI